MSPRPPSSTGFARSGPPTPNRPSASTRPARHPRPHPRPPADRFRPAPRTHFPCEHDHEQQYRAPASESPANAETESAPGAATPREAGVKGKTKAAQAAPVSTSTLVNRLWSYCELLRHSGVSTLDYVEQLTYLLFLKMADERANRPAVFRRNAPEQPLVPEGRDWKSLMTRSAEALLDHYEFILKDLGQRGGTMLGEVFTKAQNKIQEPAVLERLIKDLIDPHTWTTENQDLKGDAYEGLLQRGAEDRKTGAGQYFTPRPLIDAMVDCVQPKPGETITDPACGTGGFLIAAHAHLVQHYEDELYGDRGRALQTGAITGYELVRETGRLALMNMLLHGIGNSEAKPLITIQDSLARPRSGTTAWCSPTRPSASAR